MTLDYSNFNLELSIFSGQCFEWQKINDWFYGEIFPGSIIKIKQIGNVKKGYLEYEVFGNDVSESQIRYYFSLIKEYDFIISSLLNKHDPFLTKSISVLNGIRLINQDPLRCTMSFIISANNNVKNISNSVALICKKFGSKIQTDIGEINIFPKLQILKEISESDYRLLKLGFRSKYLAQLTRVVDELSFFDNLKTKNYFDAKSILIQIPGIGSKVADCILLYSLNKYEPYPLDVWLRRVTLECYFDNDEQVTNIIITKWASEYFGEYAGVAHMYLFVYRRSIGPLK